MSTEYAIEVNNLTKEYQDFKLNNISFRIPKGSIVGFVGENGAGKSTTMKAILGLMPIESGEIKILGNKVGIGGDESWREQIGVVFDECNYPQELRVKEIWKILKQIYKTWDDAKFMNCLTAFQLPLDKKIKDLSKGMKMKLSIAAALGHDSRVLILDEATSGLDPVIRNEILDIFQEYTMDEEKAVFLSSHITSDIEKIADYIMFIHKGQLLFYENKDDLIYNYGMVKCSQKQAERIPEEIIVGMQRHAFGVNVLVKNKNLLLENGFEDTDEEETQPVIDKVSIEDILLYIVKSRETMKNTTEVKEA